MPTQKSRSKTVKTIGAKSRKSKKSGFIRVSAGSYKTLTTIKVKMEKSQDRIVSYDEVIRKLLEGRKK